MKTEELIKLIFDNWAQTTIIIGAIGYLLKVLFDRKSKQIEIKTKIYYENKFSQIEIINNQYSDLNIAYKELLAIKEITPENISKIIESTKIIAELYKSIRHSLNKLSIYTDFLQDEYQPEFKSRLNQLLESIEIIKSKEKLSTKDKVILNTVILNLDVSFQKMIKKLMK